MCKQDWNVYGMCPKCGHSELAPLGDMWFLEMQLNVCPKCGTSVIRWEKRVGRRVIVKKGKYFWSRDRYYMEWKDE